MAPPPCLLEAPNQQLIHTRIVPSDPAKMNLKHGMVTACSLLLTLAVAGCGGSKAATSPAPAPEVSVVTVHKGSVPMTTELPGRTSAVLVAQVRGRVDGIVLARDFTEGADVKANQRLFQIDPAPHLASL